MASLITGRTLNHYIIPKPLLLLNYKDTCVKCGAKVQLGFNIYGEDAYKCKECVQSCTDIPTKGRTVEQLRQLEIVANYLAHYSITSSQLLMPQGVVNALISSKTPNNYFTSVVNKGNKLIIELAPNYLAENKVTDTRLELTETLLLIANLMHQYKVIRGKRK